MPIRRQMPYWTLAAIIIFLSIVPFLLVIAVSLGQNIEGAAWEWGFTYENFKRFFVGADWPNSVSLQHVQQLWYSLFFAMAGSLIAVVTAFPFTWTLTRLSRRVQTVWLIFFLTSMSLSEVFVAMGWDVLLSNRSGLPMVLREMGVTQWLKDIGWFDVLREWGLANPRDLRFKPTSFATILTMTYLVWPYAVILLYPPLSRVDNSMIEAARTMGATPFTTIRTVVLPIVRLPIIGTTLLLFVFLLGAYVVISVFAAPSKQTLAVAIYDTIHGLTLNAPFGAAQAIVLLVSASILLIISLKLTHTRKAESP